MEIVPFPDLMAAPIFVARILSATKVPFPITERSSLLPGATDFNVRVDSAEREALSKKSE